MNKRYLFFGALLLNAFGALSQAQLPPCSVENDPEVVHGHCLGQDFILVFEEEFDESYLDQKTWGIRWPQGAGYMNPDEPCQEWNTINNVSINNGVATITAKYDPGDRLQVQDTSHFGTDHYLNLRPYQFTSSNLWSNYVFRSGYFEIKCKVPPQGGYWPAFWLYNGKSGLGDPELDVFEMWDDNPNDINMTIHNGGKQCGEMYHIETANPWYTIGAYWDDWSILWMVNGHAVQETYRLYMPIPPHLTGLDCETAGVFEGSGIAGWVNEAFPTTPMQIAFNLAVRKGTTSTAGATPATMDVDYIRYYEQRSNCGDEETYTTTASLGLDNDATIMGAYGKPYYHNITRRIINVNGNVTLLNDIGGTQIPQQLKLTAAEGFNFNLDATTGLPVSNSAVIFEIQPGAVFEAVIDPSVCSNTPYLPQRNVVGEHPAQMIEGLVSENGGSLGLTKDPFKPERVSISPNPSNQDVVTVQSTERTKVIITNSLGRKVKEVEVQAGSNQLNVQDMSSGVYQLYFEALKETVKLVRL